MKRSYYSNSIAQFLEESTNSVLGALVTSHEFVMEEQQRNAWIKQIEFLRKELRSVSGGFVCFEYSIPRMGKRVDCVILLSSVVFVLEFKIGSEDYPAHAIEQVLDYALDLKNFHLASHNAPIVPVLICTGASIVEPIFSVYEDEIVRPVRTNGVGLITLLEMGVELFKDNSRIDPIQWELSTYKPTPTIIEAAQALYRGHNVEEISRSDAGGENLSVTANAITEVVKASRSQSRKAICFITGVPGAGKTLAGLNIANACRDPKKDDHAVFLSGNGPLVDVLREALTRDKIASQGSDSKMTKSVVRRETESFIQNIHHFRDDAIRSPKAPPEHVVIFDEAQRAWSKEQTSSFMKRKKGKDDWNLSEPEFLIQVMNRHDDWAVIICLIGGGQEINTGESGIQEWICALERTFSDWDVHVSDRLVDHEYTNGQTLISADSKLNVIYNASLHLATCVRSFRTEKVASFVKALLDIDRMNAQKLVSDIVKQFPILLTRDLNKAKSWLRSKARGSERYGILASSGALRLKPLGINVHAPIDHVYWFLNAKTDVRSSYYLEDVATEFVVQGLELDWTCVVWDGDLRVTKNGLSYKSFRGNRWQDVAKSASQMFLKNAYRVLLTRARQGMVIVVPNGHDDDHSRVREYYDPTYEYLKHIGIPSLDDLSR